MFSKLSGATALVLAATALAGTPVLAQEGENQTLAGAISSGKATIGFRYRYEYVNDDNPSLADDTAHASTMRLRLNYKTGSYNNWSAFGEFDYVGEILARDFNSLSGSSPARDDYPVVADGKGPDLNQLYLDYDPSDITKLRFGRQRILLDNQRFVGGVGWRQNEQTYDGVSFNTKFAGNTQFKYAYVTTVRRIFGNDVPSGRHDVDAHLLNVNVKLTDEWAVTPYYYYIDNEDAAGASTGTFGVRAAGNVAVGGSKLALLGEFASQSDAANNSVSYDADYFHVSAALTLENSLSFGLAYESLGGDQEVENASFRTPLATLHAFNGWADKFLSTPDEGINDLYATIKGKAGRWNLTGVFHDFSAESGSSDWGTEFDVSAGRPINERYGILFKAAFYDADQHSDDTTKFWIMLTGNY